MTGSTDMYRAWPGGGSTTSFGPLPGPGAIASSAIGGEYEVTKRSGPAVQISEEDRDQAVCSKDTSPKIADGTAWRTRNGSEDPRMARKPSTCDQGARERPPTLGCLEALDT